MTPDNARAELWALQMVCESAGISYVDTVWHMRCAGTTPMKPSNHWPFKPANERNNVTPIKRRK